jgi:MoaA/NifB/PqqE/SkfB family radical SAM enzyme
VESIYWVISRDCNQRCPHCYNDSAPGAPGLGIDDIPRVVANLPEPGDVAIDRIILSGGEVLVWPELLFAALCELHDRYRDRVRLFIQTNGDLLDGPTLDRLLDHHVSRISVSGMDRYHWKSTRERRGLLAELFESRGMVPTEVIERDTRAGARGYAFWGATEDLWIGKLWPRGRAMQK